MTALVAIRFHRNNSSEVRDGLTPGSEDLYTLSQFQLGNLHLRLVSQASAKIGETSILRSGAVPPSPSFYNCRRNEDDTVLIITILTIISNDNFGVH